ncbi:MAG TPA: MBL fold metallo-hydrolase [Bryobacteraceae bacterium]|nr:MBL fold metallo-hydrolase [Bryobacteraceae bacterium]
MNRRDFLGSVAAGALGLWTARRVFAQRSLSEKITVLDAGGANVVAFHSDDGLVLLDSGVPKSGPAVSSVRILFNTHYHIDQTGNNEMFTAAGAKIIAHERTRQWMSTDYWVPAEDRYEKARPKSAWPTEVFETARSWNIGDEQIDCGYLPLAHTSGDIYVHFRNANVLAVGDVASPVRDPALDWFTGAWIGGRVDAMDQILKLAKEETKIVPAYGPVMTRAGFKAERDMMEEVRKRLFDHVREGEGPRDMLEAGLLNGLPRTWKDPSKFLYDAAKGLWAHHDKLGPNVV